MQKLKRVRHKMPSDIRELLTEKGLIRAYRARPPYQRNDYLGWIARAVQPGTRRKRIELMVLELEAGEGFMTMQWAPPRAKAKAAKK